MTACCRNAEAEKQTYRCEKHRIEMCGFCLKCNDPELYCKFRSACMIHFLEKERAGRSGRKSSPGECGGDDSKEQTGIE